MSDLADFVTLLSEPGPWTFAYCDGSRREFSRSDLENDLLHADAPGDDVAPLLRAFDEAATSHVSSPVRYIIVRGGELIVNAALSGHRCHREFAGHDSIPPVLPMLWHGRDFAATAMRRARTPEEHVQVGGTRAVMQAVQRGQVRMLMLDVRMWTSEKTLEALAAEPWVDDRERTDVAGYGPVAVAEALARAALLSGARVVVEDRADEAARSARAARPPRAILSETVVESAAPHAPVMAA
ncbi:MAG TPA: hypothetical protein H9800_05575 [Candidatus Microbacterium stercoravium]|uniref:Uncharacterized protein n=1 Tax=Candidatus Microbacterium stercoravium TaxID=2838697 RepID=A0A9D2H4B6_9MICO|nr:hypothetical protein [Candidatus Microbacterium stercoravium]